MRLLQAKAGLAGRAVLATLHLRWPRQAVAFAIGLWFIWVLFGRLDELDLGLVLGRLVELPPLYWMAAAITTTLSFLAVSAYDVVIGRSLGFRYRASEMARTGFVATALAQLVGLGLVTGALLRWRMLGAGEVTLGRATILTGMITVGFFAASSIPLAVAILLSDRFTPLIRLCAYAVLMIGLLCLILAIWRPKLGKWFDGSMWPKLKTVVPMVGLACVDTGLACLTFYILLPPELSLPLITVLPVFLLALAAGMLSGTPGGVGPFEMTVLVMLPTYSQDTLLTAIVGYRLIYYVLPGVLAAAYFLARLGAAGDPTAIQPNFLKIDRAAEFSTTLKPLVAAAKRCEVALLGQDRVEIIVTPSRTAGILFAQSGNSLIALADPIGAENSHADALHTFQAEARLRNLSPCFYKAGAKTARQTADFGFRSHRIGQEAVIDATGFSLVGAEYRALRRKLAQAQKAGVTIECLPSGQLPIDEMTAVSERWATTHGGERGFSMARFEPMFLPRYCTYLAHHQGQLVGFLCVWQGAGGHGIDLMRLAPNAPDGVMHRLVCAAIDTATTHGIKRFSLAAVPFYGVHKPCGLTEHCANLLFRYFPKWHDAGGLFRFKNSFRPNWEPMYLCLPTGATGLVAWLDIHRLVRPQDTRISHSAGQLRQINSKPYFSG